MTSSVLPLSVIFLTYNAEASIEVGLKSVAGWVGEIFVVDSGSTDNTLGIVARYTDNIVFHPFDNYAQQRNWAQENLPLSYDWVFHIDADEWVTSELRAALEAFFHSDGVAATHGLLIKRRTVFLGRWIKHGGHYPSYHMRVFRHEHGQCEERLYDQHFVVAGPIRRLEGGDLIDCVTSDLDTWVMRHIRWAGLEVQEILNRQSAAKPDVHVKPRATGNLIERRRWARVALYNRLPLFVRSTVYFIYRYFFRLGFLDGSEGLIFHVLQGFWFRFYIDARLWEVRHAGDSVDGRHG
ncbi:MAG: glycosyltransferase family 2 protein [Anaerolineae bacterium]